MNSNVYVAIGLPFTITQSIPESTSGDTVTIKIKRLSDGHTWNFNTQAFEPGNNTGNMTFFDGITWKQSFTPPMKDQYVVTVTHTSLDVQYAQTIIAEYQSSTVKEEPDTSSAAMLSAINKAIASRINGGAVESYSIGGRNLKYVSLDELYKLRENLRREVNASKGPAQTYARFRRPS